MKKTLIRFPILLLLVALLTDAGLLSGRTIAELLNRLDLISRWRPPDGLPEVVEELLVPSNGTVYIRGLSVETYCPCGSIDHDTDCWVETEYPTRIAHWECGKLEHVPKPPSDPVASVINCSSRHNIEITEVALSSDGRLW